MLKYIKIISTCRVLGFAFAFLMFCSPAAESNSDFSITLNEGWNILSTPLWADSIVINENDIEAWLVYRDGDWVHGGSINALINELNNPARAVYIRAAKPTQITFNWSEIAPHLQFASVELKPGWNLISSSLRADYYTILAGVIGNGNQGVSRVYAPNEYNSRKQSGYYLTWKNKMNELVEFDLSRVYDMFPFDGYWVYLDGDSLIYSTPVGSDVPEKTGY